MVILTQLQTGEAGVCSFFQSHPLPWKWRFLSTKRLSLCRAVRQESISPTGKQRFPCPLNHSLFTSPLHPALGRRWSHLRCFVYSPCPGLSFNSVLIRKLTNCLICRVLSGRSIFSWRVCIVISHWLALGHPLHHTLQTFKD